MLLVAAATSRDQITAKICWSYSPARPIANCTSRLTGFVSPSPEVDELFKGAALEVLIVGVAAVLYRGRCDAGLLLITGYWVLVPPVV
jgi:hypothetical protein